jgi:hypothetical protein
MSNEDETYDAYMERAGRAAEILAAAGFKAEHVDEGSSGLHNTYIDLDSGHGLVVYTNNPPEGYGWSMELFDQPGGTSLHEGEPVQLEIGDDLTQLPAEVREALRDHPTIRRAFAKTAGMHQVPFHLVPVGATAFVWDRPGWMRGEVIEVVEHKAHSGVRVDDGQGGYRELPRWRITLRTDIGIQHAFACIDPERPEYIRAWVTEAKGKDDKSAYTFEHRDAIRPEKAAAFLVEAVRLAGGEVTQGYDPAEQDTDKGDPGYMLADLRIALPDGRRLWVQLECPADQAF